MQVRIFPSQATVARVTCTSACRCHANTAAPVASGRLGGPASTASVRRPSAVSSVKWTSWAVSQRPVFTEPRACRRSAQKVGSAGTSSHRTVIQSIDFLLIRHRMTSYIACGPYSYYMCIIMLQMHLSILKQWNYIYTITWYMIFNESMLHAYI